MSTEIFIAFEIHDLSIVKETVKKLGYTFTEPRDNTIEIDMEYHPIVIDAEKGAISYDSDHVSQVNKIKQSYMVDYYTDKAIREGNQIQIESGVNEEIIINII